MEQIQAFLQKWRVRLGHLFALFIIAFAKPQIELLIVGTIISLAGESLRIYSAGMIQKDEVLTRGGPYAYTRNPLYLGSFFMSLGFCVASSNYYIIGAFIVFFFVVYYATIFREEAFLSQKFGDNYVDFCHEVPRLFPRITPVGRIPNSGFSWAQVSKNKEHEGLIATLIILALLWAMGLTGRFPMELIIK